MDVTYERDIECCKTNPNVVHTTVEKVEQAENSDFLNKITLKGLGWSLIGRVGTYSTGDNVTFIPPDSVLPKELSDELGVTKFLSKGKVRVVRLRGNRSEGLITDTEKVLPYMKHILKWEDPPSVHMGGDAIPSIDIPVRFEKFYKIPNLLDEPNTFEQGEKVSFSEKIHGTNIRAGHLQHPETGEYQLYVGSHNIVLSRNDDKTVYWRVASEVSHLLPEDYLFFGEVFGKGIQHLHYDRPAPDVLFFAAMHRGEYLRPVTFKALCDECGIPRVKIHPTVFSSVETCRKWANLESEYTDSHMREGVVITSAYRKGVMAKVISFDYLTTKKRTERH